MCLSALFPKPPNPTAPPPAKKADPIVKAPPKSKSLLTPEDIAKVEYGGQRKVQQTRDKVTADSLKINLGGESPTANTGGLNV